MGVWSQVILLRVSETKHEEVHGHDRVRDQTKETILSLNSTSAHACRSEEVPPTRNDLCVSAVQPGENRVLDVQITAGNAVRAASFTTTVSSGSAVTATHEEDQSINTQIPDAHHAHNRKSNNGATKKIPDQHTTR